MFYFHLTFCFNVPALHRSWLEKDYPKVGLDFYFPESFKLLRQRVKLLCRCTWICHIYFFEWNVICWRVGTEFFYIKMEHAPAGMSPFRLAVTLELHFSPGFLCSFSIYIYIYFYIEIPITFMLCFILADGNYILSVCWFFNVSTVLLICSNFFSSSNVHQSMNWWVVRVLIGNKFLSLRSGERG